MTDRDKESTPAPVSKTPGGPVIDRTPPLDMEEIDAVHDIVRHLSPLSDEAKARAIRTVVVFFELEPE